jgi:hypothetical protein
LRDRRASSRQWPVVGQSTGLTFVCSAGIEVNGAWPFDHRNQAHENESMRRPILKNYSFLWITLALFLGSLIGHWTFGWFAYVADQEAHQQSVRVGEFVIQAMRDTLENWQSEFLQLVWQVAGLAFLLHVGSPQSKEGDERKEEKLDRILAAVDAKNAERIIEELDRKYPRT